MPEKGQLMCGLHKDFFYSFQIISSMETGTSADEQTDMPEPSKASQEHATAQSVPEAKNVPEAQSTLQQKRRPAKRKRVSATEMFHNTLLEQQSKLIAALEDATKFEQVLRERQVNVQKLMDLMSQFFNKDQPMELFHVMSWLLVYLLTERHGKCSTNVLASSNVCIYGGRWLLKY